MRLSEDKIKDIISILETHKLDSLSNEELYTFEHLRDAATSLELIDLEKAYALMKLALLFRPNAPLVNKKLNLYSKMLAARANGFIKVKDVTLSVDRNISPLVLRSLAIGGYESEEITLAQSRITEDDIVLELGAGIGFLANSISPLCKRYISYEANPNLIPLIETGKNINNSNFEINHGVVLDREGELEFYMTPDFWGSSLVKPKGKHKTTYVKSFSKNKIMRNVKPTALIVDIEGGEYDFFDNLECKSVKKIILEIHPNVLSDKQLCDLYRYFFDNQFVLDFKHPSKNVLYWYR